MRRAETYNKFYNILLKYSDYHIDFFKDYERTKKPFLEYCFEILDTIDKIHSKNEQETKVILRMPLKWTKTPYNFDEFSLKKIRKIMEPPSIYLYKLSDLTNPDLMVYISEKHLKIIDNIAIGKNCVLTSTRDEEDIANNWEYYNNCWIWCV